MKPRPAPGLREIDGSFYQEYRMYFNAVNAPAPSKPGLMQRGFTVPELLAVVAVITIIISLLLPSFQKARVRTWTAICGSSMHQLAIAHKLYTLDNRRILPRLEYGDASSIPANAIVPFYGRRVWTDMLHPQYVTSRNAFDCPAAQKATNPAHPTLGIGLNHIQLSYSPWTTLEIHMRDVVSPSASVVMADSGKIVNHSEPNPDKWVELRGEPTFYFLTPDHSHHHIAPSATGGISGQRRVFNRHDGNTNAAFLDGHVELMPTGKIGFQLWPGANALGQPATGDTVINGGNGQYDSRWLWDRK